MVRFARPADYEGVDAVLQAAFGRGDEVRLVRRLRADEEVMFELVAEQDGQIVGHILYSRLWADRPDLYASLGPLSVHPRVHKSGVGGRLMRGGIEHAREFGACGILVLGDPAYYGRFGFTRQAVELVKCPYTSLPAFQALALEDNAFETPVTIAYPNAFAEGPSGPL